MMEIYRQLKPINNLLCS